MPNTDRSIYSVPLMCLALGACGPTAGARPEDASAAKHETAAKQEEAIAVQHVEQHDPEATEVTTRCAPGRGPVCYEDVRNPTDEHRDEAERHRKFAAEHRAASQTLVAAEASACSGIAEEDRDVSPFAHQGDIRSVTPLRAERYTASGKQQGVRDAGATITFAAVPGLTAEWFQRIIDCHIARNAALGYDVPEMSFCPLALRGVQAQVRSVGNGFAVDVRSGDSAMAEPILQRAERLAQRQ